MANYDFFGATVADALRHLPGALVADFAQHTTAVRPESTPSVILVDTTAGLAAGQKININTGIFPPEGESRVIESIDSATQLTVAQAFSMAPVSGDVVNDGPAVVEAAMSHAEALVEARLPDRYRRLLTRVEGEVIVAAATAGQLTAVLGLAAADNLVLYANYTGPYADRSPADAMDPSAYELGEDGQIVTFSPALTEGTRIVADYDHDLADGIGVLADLLAEVAAVRLARFVLGHRPEWVEALAAEANERLAALAEGRSGVPELDIIRLYDDWERTVAGTRVGYLERS